MIVQVSDSFLNRELICPACGYETSIPRVLVEDGNDWLRAINASVTLNPLMRTCCNCNYTDDVQLFDNEASVEISDGFLYEVMSEFPAKSVGLLLYAIRLGREWFELACEFDGYIPALDFPVFMGIQDNIQHALRFVDLSPEEIANAVFDVQGIWKVMLEYGLIPYEGQYAHKEIA